MSNSRRTWAHPPSKWDRLKPAQKAALRSWLVNEKITYETAMARMLHCFGVKVSQGTISQWWNKIVMPGNRRSPRKHVPLFEFEIKSASPVQVRIFSSQARLRFKAGYSQIIKRNKYKKFVEFYPFKRKGKK